MINEQISNKGYLCGRLFAVLEYTQQKANWEEMKNGSRIYAQNI